MFLLPFKSSLDYVIRWTWTNTIRVWQRRFLRRKIVEILPQARTEQNPYNVLQRNVFFFTETMRLLILDFAETDRIQCGFEFGFQMFSFSIWGVTREATGFTQTTKNFALGWEMSYRSGTLVSCRNLQTNIQIKQKLRQTSKVLVWD
jgi:hypothetical protein